MTLIEATLSMVLVAGLFVVALETVAMSRKGQRTSSDRARGELLAMDLMNEILQQAYMTTEGVDVFGLETGKSSSNRSQFTDVDDYNGWAETPPQDRSGNPLLGCDGWTRSVSVVWADASTWAPTAQTNTGLKLITVSVSRQGMPMASVSAYRSIAWVDTVPKPSDALANHPPVAAVTASRTSNRTTLSTTLDASTTTDQDGDTLSYVWNFGDGTTGNGVTVSHTYTVIGNYTATLTAYDGRGGVGTASVQLQVLP
jgi:hypothetical protein